MPYWQLFYHLVWATRQHQPLLNETIEPVVYDWLRGKAISLGATVYALNGTADHIHLVVSIPPDIAVAKFLSQIRSAASANFEKSGLSPTALAWQEEFGAITFDEKRLPNFVRYVEGQKSHHAEGTLISILERTGEPGHKPLRETPADYLPDDAEWRRELDELG